LQAAWAQAAEIFDGQVITAQMFQARSNQQSRSSLQKRQKGSKDLYRSPASSTDFLRRGKRTVKMKRSHHDMCDEITKLEHEIKCKLNLGARLGEENEELKLKEKMFQLHVENGDRTVACGTSEGMSAIITDIVKGEFRSSMLQSMASSAIQTLPKVFT